MMRGHLEGRMNYCVICGIPCKHHICDECNEELADLPGSFRQKIIKYMLEKGHPKPKSNDDNDDEETQCNIKEI